MGYRKYSNYGRLLFHAAATPLQNVGRVGTSRIDTNAWANVASKEPRAKADFVGKHWVAGDASRGSLNASHAKPRKKNNILASYSVSAVGFSRVHEHHCVPLDIDKRCLRYEIPRCEGDEAGDTFNTAAPKNPAGPNYGRR